MPGRWGPVVSKLRVRLEADIPALLEFYRAVVRKLEAEEALRVGRGYRSANLARFDAACKTVNDLMPAIAEIAKRKEEASA